MPFSLNPTQVAMKTEFMSVLEEVETKLKTAITKYNEEVEPLRTQVNAALDDYNDVIQKLREFCEDIANEADDEILVKGEKWQNSDKGQQALNWKEEWEQADFEELEIDFPDDLDVEVPDNGTTLSMLSKSAK
jgi:ElaB/YqjD/DUF883 family membrane-anchored ribosome-binding protein